MGQRGWSLPMLPGGRNSSAKPKLPLLSPSAATLSGYSAPQTPGPEIGLIRTSSGVSLTAPDFRHAISASARHGSRSAEKNPRPQPARETRTKEPTRYKQTPRPISTGSANIFKDSTTPWIHIPLTMRPHFQRGSDRNPDFFNREPLVTFRVDGGSDVNQGVFPMTFMAPFANKLSVVAAYVAFAFVGAIVLGVF